MSDEEKEALEILKSFEPDDLVECAIYLQALERITNLIEKQQKEIEELKEKNKRLEKFIENGEHTWKQKYNETFKYVENEFVSKDKIKAKIEECDMKDLTICYGGRSQGRTFQQAVRTEVKKILQSLLEKEELW